VKALRGLLRHALIDVPAFWRYDPRPPSMSASGAH
jgi:hypothetical protein